MAVARGAATDVRLPGAVSLQRAPVKRRRARPGHHLDDETYRQRILTRLHRTESCHARARAVFHGQRGHLRQRHREGQEDQLSALGLVVNAIVLGNTRYQNAALDQLRRTGYDVCDNDVRHLSPLATTTSTSAATNNSAPPTSSTDSSIP